MGFFTKKTTCLKFWSTARLNIIWFQKSNFTAAVGRAVPVSHPGIGQLRMIALGFTGTLSIANCLAILLCSAHVHFFRNVEPVKL